MAIKYKKWCVNKKCGRKQVIYIRKGYTYYGIFKCEACNKEFTIDELKELNNMNYMMRNTRKKNVK